MKRIVLFVEGEGDATAAPQLVKRLLTEYEAWDVVIPDNRPFRVGQINKLVKNDYREWKRKLLASLKRPNVGGVLLLLDGDIKRVGSDLFCAATVAQSLAEVARSVGGGSTFSVATVFAMREYESWLVAGVQSFSGKTFPDGRSILPNATIPRGNLEETLRDAKGWLKKNIDRGYKQTRDQAILTGWLELQVVRDREMRSFQRLESALGELVEAIRTGDHVATPTEPNQ
jgi:Domain of unknown function (DUF4276)